MTFTCYICSNTFTQKKNLKTHLNEKRCKSELLMDLNKLNEYLIDKNKCINAITSISKTFTCYICLYNFTQKKNLYAHLNEKRCKSPLLLDLWKLNEFLLHKDKTIDMIKYKIDIELCKHSINSLFCILCNVCEHNNIKVSCKNCKNINKTNKTNKTKECEKTKLSRICSHNKRRYDCRECDGKRYCQHDKQKYQCIVCSPNSNYFCKSCRLFSGVSKINDYLCSYCNPNKTIKRKTKENNIRDLLLKNNITFIQNKSFTNDCCLKYRPDFLIDCGSYFIVAECDEDAHKQYDKDCELIRMNNISIGLGLPVKWIRYNPDNNNYKKKYKEKVLIETLQNVLNKEFIDNMEVEYLFY